MSVEGNREIKFFLNNKGDILPNLYNVYTLIRARADVFGTFSRDVNNNVIFLSKGSKCGWPGKKVGRMDYSRIRLAVSEMIGADPPKMVVFGVIAMRAGDP